MRTLHLKLMTLMIVGTLSCFLSAVLLSQTPTVVNLPAGNIGFLVVHSNTIYNASPLGTTVTGTQGVGNDNVKTMQTAGVSNVTFNSIVFKGAGIKLDNTTDLTFNDCWVMDSYQALQGGGNTRLVMNRFHIFNATWSIQLYNGTGGSWTDCTMEKIGYGWKWSTGGVKDVRIIRLIIKHCRAMGVEFQYDTADTDMYLEDCAYIDPDRYDNDSQNDGATMAFSIPNKNGKTKAVRCFASGYAWILNADGTPKMVNGQQVRRASSSAWAGVRVGFEGGGQGSVWDSCWADRVNDSWAIVVAPPSHGEQLINCLATGCNERADYEGNADAAHVGSNAVQDSHGAWYFKTDGVLPMQGGWSPQLPPAAPAAPTTRPATQPAGKYVFASTQPFTTVRNGWGPVEINLSNGEQLAKDGHPLTLRGWVYSSGLGVHAESEVQYTLGGKYKTVVADVGIDDETNGAGVGTFQVWSGPSKLWDSGGLNGKDSPRALSLDVTGLATINLKVTAGTINTSAHGDWGFLRFVPADPIVPPIPPTTLPVDEVKSVDTILKYQSGKTQTFHSTTAP